MIRIKLILIRVKKILYKVSSSIYYLFKSKGNLIVLNAWIDLRYGSIRKRNFGDELSYYILCELTDKTIASHSTLFYNYKKFDLMFIGSLIEEYTNQNTIIWGSGAIRGDIPLKNKPAKVCAVRGKYTREYLLKNGIECPEIYGDPALLLPLIYKPKVKKKYKMGLIPHYVDEHHPLILRLLNLDENIKLISLTNYEDWHSVIDYINECDFVVSSSLHGLIISDAYNIPNLWVRVSDEIVGGNFKYYDYFSGVGRTIRPPLILNEYITLKDLIMGVEQYECIQYDIASLIKACPVELNFNMNRNN